MKKNKYTKIVLMGLLCVPLIACKFNKQTSQSVDSKPNVIVLLADDQGYGDIAVHGNPHLKTPNLDKMYTESVRFTDFHTSSICTPTRSQLITGLDAVRNGAYNYGFGKTNIFKTYPDVNGNQHEIHLMSDYFKANGYSTGHFGKWHLGDFYPYRSMDRGFDETYTFPGASVWQTPNYWNNDCFDDMYVRNGVKEKSEGYCTDVWFKETINFIEESTKNNKPFFVYLPTSAMHTPQYVPAKYLKDYKNLPSLVAQFYGMITNFDENLGVLDATLEKLLLKENTIVIYLSDNGGTCGVKEFNAGMKGKKCSLYEGGHRVPCFVRWPRGINHVNRDVNDLTVVQDVLPTLIDLCDLKTPWKQKFDGVSLANLLTGKKQDLLQRMSVVQFSTKREGLNGYTVLWNKWRLVNGKELYDVTNDIGQKNNVALAYPNILEKMQKHYLGWRKSVAPSLQKNSQISIGYKNFKELELTCFDWLTVEGKGNPSQQIDIRDGKPMHGTWNLNVEQKGTYELIFRRWPKETNKEINAGLPPFFTEFSKQIGAKKGVSDTERHYWQTICPNGIHPKGVTLPITKINFLLNGTSQIKKIKSTDKSVTYTVSLPKGKATVGANFLDANNHILCGAYYLDIIKKI